MRYGSKATCNYKNKKKKIYTTSPGPKKPRYARAQSRTLNTVVKSSSGGTVDRGRLSRSLVPFRLRFCRRDTAVYVSDFAYSPRALNVYGPFCILNVRS